VERRDPDLVGDELPLLTQFLDWHRATLVGKASGLAKDQLAASLPSSDLTLAGLVKHLALVEDHWFQETLLGHDMPEPWASAPWDDDRDWDFHSAVDDDPADLFALYAAACDRSRAAVRKVGDLTALSARRPPRRDYVSLRWILLHMIEETARHNGHADLLRESIDGATGQ
jgi:uncharacterized damage-inducible protein DinB